MTTLIISALATAFVISAFEGLVQSLGKWRGLVALVLSSISVVIFNSGLDSAQQVLVSFGASFLSITFSMLAISLVDMSDTRVVKGMPRRIPPL